MCPRKKILSDTVVKRKLAEGVCMKSNEVRVKVKFTESESTFCGKSNKRGGHSDEDERLPGRLGRL